MARLFGTDGIRGVAGTELTPELARSLGRAAVEVLGRHGATQPPTFVVGRDPRESGEWLEDALTEGIVAAGGDVLLAGVEPTPAIAFMTVDLGASSGVVISASHNPADDNGIKFFSREGMKLPDHIEDEIERELDRGPQPVTRRGRIAATPEGREGYAAHLVRAADARLDGMTVVVDCANGAAFRAAPRVLRELGAHVEVLHAAPNGSNINDGCGSTDPSDLQRAVVAVAADAGLAFDGDADRLIAVDEKGEIVDGDQLLAIAAFDLQERGQLRHNAVVVTQMANGGLHHTLRDAGIEVVEVEVGDRNVLDALARRDLSLGGEQSGHIIFPDLATTGDGVLTGALLLDVLDGTGQRLSTLAGIVQRTPQVLRSVPVQDPNQLDTDRNFWRAAQEARAELGDDGRVLVRPSGTEPVVRVMVEAPTWDEAERTADDLATAVELACGVPER